HAAKPSRLSLHDALPICEDQDATGCHRLRQGCHGAVQVGFGVQWAEEGVNDVEMFAGKDARQVLGTAALDAHPAVGELGACLSRDRKSTRLNSSHLVISY